MRSDQPPKPIFCIIDPPATHKELLKAFSDLLGKTIYPAQYEYLLGDMATYLYTLAQVDFQNTGEQSLVNFATGINLEQLGALLGVSRLPPSAAQSTLLFSIAIAQTTDVFIPKGTRVRTNDRRLIFETTTDAIIPGTPLTAPVRFTSVSVRAQCQTLGESGNQYVGGTINLIIDIVPAGLSVSASNTTMSSGGVGQETDDRLRDRIKLAPAAFSVAGSEEAYKFFAFSASPFIQDVGIVSPDPSGVIAALQTLINGVSTTVQSAATLAAAQTVASTTAIANTALVQSVVAALAKVRVYVLTQTGLPTPEIKALVTGVLNSTRVRPLTDLVEVLDPTPISYTVSVRLTLFNFAVSETVVVQTKTEIKKITDTWAAKLGADIVPEQLISAIVPIASQQGGVYGVYRAEVLSPSYQALNITQWAQLTTEPTITIVGVTTG